MLAPPVAESTAFYTGLLALLAVMAAVVAAAVILSRIDRRRSEAPRVKIVRIPHKSGHVIPFPNRRVRLICRWKARHRGTLRRYHTRQRRQASVRTTRRRLPRSSRPPYRTKS